MSKTELAVIVTIDLFPSRIDDFMPLLLENASESVGREPDCTRFDILLPEEPDQIVLYEIYSSNAAFEFHLTTDHFKSFDVATQEMVRVKKVQRLSLHTQVGN